MGNFSLQPGVWSASAGLALAGAAAVIGAPEGQVALIATGWLTIAIGVILAVWGLRYKDQPWWRTIARQWHNRGAKWRRTPKYKFEFANDKHFETRDCAIEDAAQNISLDFFARIYFVTVRNVGSTTIPNLTVVIGATHPLDTLQGTISLPTSFVAGETVDLEAGSKKEFLLGYSIHRSERHVVRTNFLSLRKHKNLKKVKEEDLLIFGEFGDTVKAVCRSPMAPCFRATLKSGETMLGETQLKGR